MREPGRFRRRSRTLRGWSASPPVLPRLRVCSASSLKTVFQRRHAELPSECLAELAHVRVTHGVRNVSHRRITVFEQLLCPAHADVQEVVRYAHPIHSLEIPFQRGWSHAEEGRYPGDAPAPADVLRQQSLRALRDVDLTPRVDGRLALPARRPRACDAEQKQGYREAESRMLEISRAWYKLAQQPGFLRRCCPRPVPYASSPQMCGDFVQVDAARGEELGRARLLR